MPRIKSAKKAMRQARHRHEHNKTQRSAMRTAVKRVRQATSREAAGVAYAAAVRQLDRAASKGLIHANNAARHKSRLANYVRSLKT